MPLAMRGRRQVWSGRVLLAVFALGLAGAAAAALGPEDCCREMHGAAHGSCESIAPSVCCGGPLAVHAATDTPAVPKALIAAPACEPLPLPLFARRSGAESAQARAEARLLRSVVLRL
jgi:hypothetical protein